jgi:nitrite reductase (NADH) large subunit
MKQKIVIVGNGMVGARLAEELVATGQSDFDIAVIGAEPGGAYSRILLTPLLANELDEVALVTHSMDWYANSNITLVSGRTITAIKRDLRYLLADDGSVIPYDRLVLATGSQAIRLPVPGAELPGVIAYRNLADTRRLIENALPGRRAMVVGGGLLGLEAANGLVRRGMAVTVIHRSDTLMERQLDRPASNLVRRGLTGRDIQFHMPAEIHSISGDDRVTGVTLADGMELPADLVVMAVGIRPEIALAQQAGLTCARGIVVDDHMVTSDPLILAVGECAEHRGIVYGLVAPLYEQARVAVSQLLGGGARYAGSITATGLKVTGIDVYSAGDFKEIPGRSSVRLSDPGRGLYRKLVIEDDLLIGAVLIGAVADGPWYASLISERLPLGRMRRDLIFGRAYAEQSVGEAAA